MKNLILYFSATGNTEYVCRYIKNRTNSDQYSLETFDFTKLKDYDSVTVGFPVFAGALPVNVREILRRFPNANLPLYLICTKAFYSGLAIQQAYRILKTKGYRLYGTLKMNMPGSDGLAFLKKDSAFAKKLLNKNFLVLPLADHFIENMRNPKKEQHLRFNPLNSMGAYLMMAIYPPFLHSFKKKFYADSACIRCEICEKICTTGNIKVTDSVRFADQCILCMRCIHQCPEGAVQIGKGTVGKLRYHGPLGDYKLHKKE